MYYVLLHCSTQFEVPTNINVKAPRNQNPSTWDPTSSSMLGGRTDVDVIMDRQVPTQNRNALPQRTKTVTESKITPKTPEMIQALLRHHPTMNTRIGNDGTNR